MRRLIVSILLLSTSATPALALDIKSECYIEFTGTSFLHSFSGTVKSNPFKLTVSNGEDGRKTISSVEINVPVGKINTDNEKRDRKMREMFQSDRFHLIHGVIKDLDPERIRQEMRGSENGEVILSFVLTIRDVEQRIVARVRNLKELGEQVSFVLEFPVISTLDILNCFLSSTLIKRSTESSATLTSSGTRLKVR